MSVRDTFERDLAWLNNEHMKCKEIAASPDEVDWQTLCYRLSANLGSAIRTIEGTLNYGVFSTSEE